jgi:hypothetical protein
VEHFVVGSKKARQFVADPTSLVRADDLKDVIVFANEIEGRARGYVLRDGAYIDAYLMARIHPAAPTIAPAAPAP